MYLPQYEVEQNVEKGRAFTVNSDLIQIAQNEVVFLLLKNPVTSKKQAMITHFSSGTDSSSVRTLMRIYANPQITSDGTEIAIVNTHITASPLTSELKAYKIPDITSNGIRLNLQISPSNSPSKGLNRFYLLDPSNSILITLDNSSSNTKSFAEAYWLEV